MAFTYKLPRLTTAGTAPTVGQLELGVVALNIADGRAFFKTDDGATEGIQEIGKGTVEVNHLTVVKNVQAGDLEIIPSVTDYRFTYDPSQYALVRVDVANVSEVDLALVSGPAGIAIEGQVLVIGQPTVTWTGVTPRTRMADLTKVEGDPTVLGTTLTLYRLLWTGYEWLVLKDVLVN